MEGWFKPSDVASAMMLLQHGGSGALWIDDGDSGLAGFQPKVFFRADEHDPGIAVSDDTLTAGDWWHVVGTYDGVKAKLYVNKASASTPLALPVEPDDEVNVHYEPSGFGHFLRGLRRPRRQRRLVPRRDRRGLLLRGRARGSEGEGALRRRSAAPGRGTSGSRRSGRPDTEWGWVGADWY